MKAKFDVSGMSCAACSSRVEKTVAKLGGVRDVSVNLLTNSMLVDYDESALTDGDISAAVSSAGYGAERADGKAPARPDEKKSDPVKDAQKAMKRRVILSFAFLVPLMYVAMGHMIGLPLPGFLSGTENAVGFALTQLLLCLPVAYINRSYYTRGFGSLFHGAPNMDTLIAVGSAASLVYGVFAIYRMGYGLGAGDMELVHRYYHDLYFESAVMILALINLGKYLEARSKGKTSEAVTRLIDMRPRTAFVERDGGVKEIPAEDVNIGDVVQIKPGSSVPVDGVILEGSTDIDESAITGESIPAEKSPGDKVVAATVNKTGFIRVRTEKVGEDTTLSQIIALVENANAGKAPIARLADRISGVFVPIVMSIALITGIVWLAVGAEGEFALSCAIAVLVISCPCALGLATPVALMAGTGKGAENGILIKSGEALETAHSIKTVVLDKTGTITLGRPEVTVIRAYGMSESGLLGIAAAIESGSEHPLAKAIADRARETDTVIPEATDIRALPGRGIEGRVRTENGLRSYIAGNARMLAERGIDTRDNADADAASDGGSTPIFIADAEDGSICGFIGVADAIKPTSAEAVARLKDMGIEVIMLTGDNERTARAVGKKVGIEKTVSGVLPEDKEREIARLQSSGRRVAMVGDGINDAPALARADVGIAIGAGTDIAIESADIVLMKSELTDVATAIELSRAVIRNIKENLFWAFFYNACGIPLAAGAFYTAFGWKLSPMFGAAAMSVSSLFVVGNALRLRLFKPNKQKKSAEDTYGKADKQSDIEVKTQKKEENIMNYTLKIDGMMCMHCVAHVNKALTDIPGVTADVDLDAKEARVNAPADVSPEALKKAVVDAGYTVTEIKEA